MAKAYVIADARIHDAAAYDEYKRRVLPTIERHGGRFIVRGGPHAVLEGSWKPTRVVVIEFPSAAAARAWYADPDYAPLLKLRQAAADDDLVLVEGV